MAKFDIEKGLKKKIQEASGAIKHTVEEVSLPDIKMPSIKKPELKIPEQLKGAFSKKPRVEEEQLDFSNITSITAEDALRIFFYLIASDGSIENEENEMFASIGREIDTDFAEHRDAIVEECQAAIAHSEDAEELYEIIQDRIEKALYHSLKVKDSYITPKLLVWNLLTIAHSDTSYADIEAKLIRFIVRKLNIDRAVFAEMESSIQTLMDLEQEIKWIKTTDRPYLTIEAMVNEIADRKNVIFESVKDLIML